MPSVLLIEDDELVAGALGMLVELNGDYKVNGRACDLAGAIEIVERGQIDIALVDINLGNLRSGYAVAAELTIRGVDCVLVTGDAPPFPLPELARGCITKPFTAASVADALWLAWASRTRPRWTFTPGLQPTNFEAY
ncbi:response regulator [Sphingosinicella sp. CPCC 101087]|uniref:response regulator n=1 Tax=Sphingosinicella sp. CPCC 101087 TaxID=2497754 RepID=UPI0013EAAAB8|nr:response regulator [Sphingosinicella sp. CPCC 101087]